MKTVDMLAKYLSAWPEKYTRIVQGCDSVFYGMVSICGSYLEMPQAIPGEELAGLMLSEDHGTDVTLQEWFLARRAKMATDTSSAVSAKEKNDIDYRSEHLYNMKLQCLHAALIQNGNLDIINVTNIAEAINAGFDSIK